MGHLGFRACLQQSFYFFLSLKSHSVVADDKGPHLAGGSQFTRGWLPGVIS